MISGPFNLYALAMLLAGVATLSGGLLVLFRERASLVGVMYCLACIAASAWLWGYAGTYLSASADRAMPFIRVSQAGVALIPPTLFTFAMGLLQPGRVFDRLVVPFWTLSLIFVPAALFSEALLGPPYLYSWGYYANYNWLGSLLVIFLVCVLAIIVYLLWEKQRESGATPLEKRKARLLLIAFTVGSAALIDFLPAYGVPVYPLGYIPVLFLITIVGFVTWCYHLTPITPGLAARQIVEAINDFLIVLDEEGVVRVLNPRAQSLLASSTHQAEGRAIAEVMPALDFAAHRRALEGVSAYDAGELRVRAANGAELDVSVSVSVRRGTRYQATTYVYLLHDVTKRKAAERHLEYVANHDSLTKLPNRYFFQTRLHQSISLGRRSGRRTGVLFLDIDGFKTVNDSLGHAFGDKVLVEIGKRLTQSVRIEDTVARLGGDEFIIILEGLRDAKNAGQIASDVAKTIAKPFLIDGTELFVTASAGITIHPDDGDTAETLQKNADTALYRAKELGSNSYQCYSRKMNSRAIDRLQMSSELHHALEREEFVLEFQPRQRLDDGRIAGAEALLRWERRHLGRCMPDHFIPMLEKSSLILSVGRWVLLTAAQQAKCWSDAGYPLRVSVNISARQLRNPGFLNTLTDVLDESGLPAELLELEITESMLMDNTHAVERTLNELGRLGVTISIDDFGTGYSSLSYLKSFPIHVLKIDKAFVRGVTNDVNDSVIAQTIIAMAHSLGMRVVAEGVETFEQKARLQQMQCDEVQGYWLARPMRSVDLPQWSAQQYLKRTSFSS